MDFSGGGSVRTTKIRIWTWIGVLVAAGFGLSLTLASGGSSRGSLPGLNAPSRIALAPQGEPGQPLLVEGTVFRPDGKTPAAGVVLYVYHTDAKGLYNRLPGQPPRLRGWMKTDASGRYRYRTIRPAPYPLRSIAAHVHTQLWGGGAPVQYNEDLVFADDRFLEEAERRRSAAAGRFAFVCAPRVVEGVQRCTHDLRLKAGGDRFEESIRHGLEEPGGA
jgi:protocatechuate 3,4-dioxygenase beta subunit